MIKEKNVKYYDVIYTTAKEMYLTKSHDSQEEALEELKDIINTRKGWYDFCTATTVIKRDLSNCTNPDFIFGIPKSLNVKK